MPQYRIIISGGGTGGHIFPAIAIANALKARMPDCEILFVGAEGKMEMTKVPEAGYEIIGLPIRGLQRKLTLKNLSFPFKLLQSIFKAGKVISKFKPNIAIGVGGYASGPLLWIAAGRGIPSLIQEQNSYAGITNKLLGKRVKKICVAYENMERYFPKEKIIITGNPVRKSVIDPSIDRNKALNEFNLQSGRKTVLVIGGSLGARTINKSIEINLNNLKNSNIQLIWQTGRLYEEQAVDSVKEAGLENCYVNKFINNIGYAYSAADIIISRAGAISVSELTLIGKPVILIPSPNVAEDHQTKNALALVEKEAAVLVKDSEAIKQLWPELEMLLNSAEKCDRLSKNIARMGIPNSDEKIADEVIKLINPQQGNG